MSTKEKLIEKILEHPPRKDIDFDDILKVLEYYEFNCVRISGTHYIFKNKRFPIIEMDSIPKPHGGNKYLKRPYVEQI